MKGKEKTFLILSLILGIVIIYSYPSWAHHHGYGCRGYGCDCSDCGECGHHARGPGVMKGPGFLRGVEKAIEELNLTVNQKEKIKKLRQSFRAHVKAIRKEAKGLVKEIVRMLKSKNYSRSALVSKFKRMRALHDKMMEERVKLFLDTYQVLSDYQREQLWKILDKMKPPSPFHD